MWACPDVWRLPGKLQSSPALEARIIRPPTPPSHWLHCNNNSTQSIFRAWGAGRRLFIILCLVKPRHTCRGSPLLEVAATKDTAVWFYGRLHFNTVCGNDKNWNDATVGSHLDPAVGADPSDASVTCSSPQAWACSRSRDSPSRLLALLLQY